MVEGELAPPSIPIQVPDASLVVVGWTFGTIQLPVMPLKVVPVAI
jgi:hypothetical protein